jgi:hypothetical protein
LRFEVECGPSSGPPEGTRGRCPRWHGARGLSSCVPRAAPAYPVGHHGRPGSRFGKAHQERRRRRRWLAKCGATQTGLGLPRLFTRRSPGQVRGDHASISTLRCVSRCRYHASCVAIGSELDAFCRRSSAAIAKHGSSCPTAVQSAHRTFCEAGHSLESMA